MITEQQLITKKLETEAFTDERILRDLIEEHDTEKYLKGVRYYLNEPDILKRRIYIFDDNGQRQIDETATNHRVPHNWHKILVDQKVGYLCGKPVVINAEPDEYADLINVYFDEEWDDRLQEIAKNVSNKGVEWLHPYIDAEGNFDYINIPAEQCIPIYDTEYQKELVALIRYYPFWVNGRETIRAEWWTPEFVTFYIQGGNGQFVMEAAEDGKNPDSHFYYNEKGYGWGRVPFVPFKNNEEQLGDLQAYKKLLDVYDYINSDMANDLTDVQKLIYVLSGYEGTSLAEFLVNLRRYRAIKVDDVGGVDTLSAQIPVEAINAFLDRAEENIFLFGQGVNMKTDRFGHSPSGVALKFLNSLLELKANIMARKFAKSIKQFIWFFTEYMGVSDKYTAPEGALDTVSITFSRSMMVHDKEMSEIARDSKGVISDETIVANHPWVENAQLEVDRLKEQQDVYFDLDRLNESESDSDAESE